MNTLALPHLAAVAFSVLANSFSQIAGRRLMGERLSVFRSALLGLLWGAITLTVIEACLIGSSDAAAMHVRWLSGDVLMFLSASYCWLHFVNIGEASVRLRMAREILDAEPRGLTTEELASRYGIETIVDTRIQRMIESGELFHKEGRYFFGKPRMLLVARAFSLLRGFVLDDSCPAVRATRAAERFGIGQSSPGRHAGPP